MKNIFLIITLFATAQAQEIQSHEYLEKSDRYIEFKKTKDILNQKEKYNKSKLKNTKKINKQEIKNKITEEDLINIIESDNIKYFEEYVIKKENVLKLNKKLRNKNVFRYPFHQAIINKSYKIMIKMLSIKDIEVSLVEDSGTTTMDILKMYDLENYEKGREFLKSYFKRIKEGK